MDVSNIPAAEDDEFEFKSSLTPIADLKTKIPRAVSGFANSGGGFFIAGVDGTGNPDGGFPDRIGATALRDWIDQLIHQVEPAPESGVFLFDDPKGRGTIKAAHCVVAIQILSSVRAPHMAPDRKYYMRAGAHTVPARHFIVESIYARRNHSEPRLVHLADVEPFTSETSYLTIDIIALTEVPAVDVQIDVFPDPDPDARFLAFPLSVPLIDARHNFAFRFEVRNAGANFDLSVAYADVASNQFTYKAKIDSKACVTPYNRAREPLYEISRTLEKIERKLR